MAKFGAALAARLLGVARLHGGPPTRRQDGWWESPGNVLIHPESKQARLEPARLWIRLLSRVFHAQTAVLRPVFSGASIDRSGT
jgi:hypothetical protein